MKTLPFAIAFAVPFVLAVSCAHAGPILAPPSSQSQQVALELDVVGQFELQQTGNEITGSYKLTETDQTNSYEVVNPSDNQIVGEFQLTETDTSGSFQLQQSSTDQSLYVLVESGNESVGTYTQDQGNAITGNYQLSIPSGSTTAPEPGSFALAAMGAGFLVLGRFGRRTRRKAGSPELDASGT